jgi:hypothetical protein
MVAQDAPHLHLIHFFFNMTDSKASMSSLSLLQLVSALQSLGIDILVGLNNLFSSFVTYNLQTRGCQQLLW